MDYTSYGGMLYNLDTKEAGIDGGSSNVDDSGGQEFKHQCKESKEVKMRLHTL